MANLEFQKLECSATITCFSENGEIEDLTEIKDEFETALNDVLADIVSERNNVLTFEISDVVLLSDGVDTSK